MTNNLLTSTFNGISNQSLDTLFIVLASLLCVAVFVLAVWLLTKYIRKPKYAETFKLKLEAYEKLPNETRLARPQQFSFLGIWFAIACAGFIIRILFVFLTRGYRPDLYLVADDILFNSNLTSLHAGPHFHYPFITYIYAFFGLIANAFGLNRSSGILPLFVRLPLILADIGLMLVVYLAAKKHINEYTGLILAGIVAFFPPFIILSSVWGSVYAITVLLLVLTFYFIATKNMLGLFISYSLALLTSRSALYLFPVVAIFVIYQLAKASLYVRRNKIDGFKDLIKTKEAKNVFFVPLYIVAFWLGSWLVALPLLHEVAGNPFSFINFMYFTPLSTFSYFGENSMGIFNLFVGMSENGTEWGATSGMTTLFVILFALIISGLVTLVYLTRKNRALLVFLAGYIYLTLSIFFIDFGAVNMIIVVALFLLSFIFVKDKRILMLTTILGILLTINMSFIFLNAGFLTNAYPGGWNNGFPNELYTGEILLGLSSGRGAWLAANIVLSVLAIITFIYATIVVLDIAMSNKRQLLSPLEKPTFLTSLGKFFKA
ncbi:MAG: hypothetical protein FWE13_05525 [Firmicutes bacterium]|nr:hypothetical protein [Bacillota bacterium]